MAAALLCRHSSATRILHGRTRQLSTLSTNPHIYIHKQDGSSSHLLSFLPSPNRSLAIGSTSACPPTPDSLEVNPHFMRTLHAVIAKHAVHDPAVIAQAQIYASNAGASLGSGGVLFPRNHPSQMGRKKRSSTSRTSGGDGAGGASAQGGMGGGGRGGWIHVSDTRKPPDYGRVAWPEDIFGSLEVDGEGKFIDGTGRYQESGTYRAVTNEGILGLPDYLRQRLVERLREMDGK